MLLLADRHCQAVQAIACQAWFSKTASIRQAGVADVLLSLQP
jgi:hypothetical protein